MRRQKIETPKRGTRETGLRITMRIGTVGAREFNHKLQISSGTDDPKTWQQCRDAIEYLIRRERDDLIDDLIQRKRTPLEIRSIHRGAKDNEIAQIRSINPVEQALRGWLETARNSRDGGPLSPHTIRSYENAIRQVVKHVRDGETVRELPMIFTRLRNYYLNPPERNQPNQVKNAKIMALAFARDVEGKRSALHEQLSDIKSGKYKPAIPQLLTLADALVIRKALPPAAASIWWGCVMTGFRYPSEFAKTSWQIDGNTVVLAGDHLGDGRVIPLLDPTITAPALSEGRYRIHFRRITKKLHPSVTPYLGRDIFQQLITESGIDPYRMRRYMGRSEDAATEQGYTASDSFYQRHTITPALIEKDRQTILKVMRKALKEKPTINLSADD